MLAVSYLPNFTTEKYPEITNYKKNFMNELFHFTILFSWKSTQPHTVTLLLYINPYFLHIIYK